MTATMTAPEMQTREQLRDIARRRRALAEASQDAKDAVAELQENIRNFTDRLVDESDDVESELLAARKQLKKLSAAAAKADADLAAFENDNPTAEAIAEAEAALAFQAEEEAQKTVRDQFRGNIRRRLELLLELNVLEASAASLYEEALKRWPIPQLELLKAAGIDGRMLNFIPETYWNLKTARPQTPGLFGNNGRPFVAPGTFLGQALEAAGQFDPSLVNDDGRLAAAGSEASDTEED
jgi:hypothetical protein